MKVKYFFTIHICGFHFKGEMAQKKCKVLMDTYGATMLKVAASRISAKSFCCELGLCNTGLEDDGKIVTNKGYTSPIPM